METTLIAYRNNTFVVGEDLLLFLLIVSPDNI
jgi:hypothetical protein